MIRVRFAPSPTGNLHVGGLRTALLNYMYARKNGGSFILRIEDTDAVRSRPEYEESIISSLKWIGIEWDEFYRQSDRRDTYDYYFDKLINEGKAYYCFCREDECRCSMFSEEDKAEKIAAGEKYAIKLEVSEKDYIIKDIVKGRVEFKRENYKDFIIRKSDGMAVYHFAVVIDDYEMKINMIIRGEDHLSNTPVQMMIYEALGFEIPEYAHVPLFLGEDRSKLSKSHGDVSVEDFRKNGFISEALTNYILSLGISWEFEKEIYSLGECIKQFEISKISKKPSIFNFQKLKWYNKKYLSEKSIDEAEWLIEEYIKRYRGIEKDDIPENINKIIEISKDKAATIEELYEINKFFFEDNLHYDIKKLIEIKESRHIVRDILGILMDTRWETESIMAVFREFAKNKNTALKEIVAPFRYIITGQEVSAGLFEIMELLGKSEVEGRIENFLKIEK